MGHDARSAAMVGFALATALVGCNGGSGTTPAVTSSPVAYLVYPTPAPYGIQPENGLSLFFATQGLNASYRATVSATSPPCPPQCPTLPSTSSTTLPLNFNPALPSPLASVPPPVSGTYAYVAADLPAFFTNPATTYNVSLVGCPSQPAAGCASPQTIAAGSFQTNCGYPSPGPTPGIELASPPNGSTNVPDAIGLLVLQGIPFVDPFGPQSISLTSAGGSSVPVGAFTAAPSPLPSPLASSLGYGVYSAVAVPTLAPSTNYHVAAIYSGFTGQPPTCYGPLTTTLGGFTTQ